MQKEILLLAVLGIVTSNEDGSSSTDASNLKECGLPNEFLSLPDYAQKELESIWGAHIEGTDCTEEKQKTEDILAIVKQFGEEFGEEKDKGGKRSTPSSTPVEKDDPEKTTTIQVEETTKGVDGDLTSQRNTEVVQEITIASTISTTPEEIQETTIRKWPSKRQKHRSDRPNRRRLPSRIIATNHDIDYEAEDFQGHTPPPTQGKIPKAPNDYDYLDPHLKAEFKRYEHWKTQQLEGNFGRDDGEDQIRSRRRTPIGSRVIHAHPTKFKDDYHDYEQETIENEGLNSADPLAAKFDTPEAPFLKDASPMVRRKFMDTWSDQDIPSEPLRAQRIQYLAVSLLNGDQLGKYNAWATNRRRVLKAREQELSELSPAARRILRRLSNTSDTKHISIHPKIKQELRDFIERHKRRVAAKISKAVA